MWFVHDGRVIWYGFCGNYLGRGKITVIQRCTTLKIKFVTKQKALLELRVKIIKTYISKFFKWKWAPASFESLRIDPNIKLASLSYS